MGCLSADDRDNDAVSKLTSLKGRVMTTIQVNDIKIAKSEKELEKIEAAIKQGENDIKQNQYSYSDSEKQTKVNKLIDLQKDRAREKKSLDALRTYNETLKNNLTMLNSKIEEVRNIQQIKEGGDLMKELGSLDTGETLRQNIENVMMENQRQEDNIKIMQNGNNALNSDLGIQNPDDYLKSLLGTAGAAPAY
jgi:hypothetical protein